MYSHRKRNLMHKLRLDLPPAARWMKGLRPYYILEIVVIIWHPIQSLAPFNNMSIVIRCAHTMEPGLNRMRSATWEAINSRGQGEMKGRPYQSFLRFFKHMHWNSDGLLHKNSSGHRFISRIKIFLIGWKAGTWGYAFTCLFYGPKDISIRKLRVRIAFELTLLDSSNHPSDL